MRVSLFVAALAVTCTPILSAPAHAGLAGSMVSVSGYFPSSFVAPPACDPYATVCGFAQSPYAGGTTPEVDVVPTATLYEYLATATSIVVSDTQITVGSLVSTGSGLFCSTSASPCPDTFDGLVFSFTGNNPITLVTVDPSTPADFQPYSVTWSADTIIVNLLGASPLVPAADGDQLVLNVVARSVPEPSTWALLVVGFGALGWAALRRRTQQAA